MKLEEFYKYIYTGRSIERLMVVSDIMYIKSLLSEKFDREFSVEEVKKYLKSEFPNFFTKTEK